MNIEEIAKRIAELHYPNKPNAIIDEPYRQVRMETLRKQVETELKNCSIPVVSVSVCPKCGCNKMTGDGSKSWCLNERCDFVEAD